MQGDNLCWLSTPYFFYGRNDIEMAINIINQEQTRSMNKSTSEIITHYIGLSTDTKPTDCNFGSTFLEEDSTNKFIYGETGWFFKSNNSDYFHSLALGEIPKHSSIYKFGRNSAVGATEVIIAQGGVYGLPTVARTVTVTSNNVADAFPSGIGARTVRIYGLDENWLEKSELVNLGGTSVNSYLRIFRVEVITAGTITPIGGGNIGTITVSQTTSGTPMVVIDSNSGQTKCACFTVPANKKALIWSVDTTVGEGKASVNQLKTRDNTVPDNPFKTKGIRDNFQNVVGVDFKIPRLYNEKTDIVFTSISTAPTVAVSATFLIELIEV